jgi:methylated-DNA-[protein]-cysteine S-methyltransferase
MTILQTSIESPIGELTLVANLEGLCGIYFVEHNPAPQRSAWIVGDDGRFDETKAWFNNYFRGFTSICLPKFVFSHGTSFQRKVWDTLLHIPFGSTMSYGEIARTIGSEKAVRAVGAAIGHNPLSIVVPCHRVIGRNSTLTGFAGGIERKAWLLHHEGAVPTLI